MNAIELAEALALLSATVWAIVEILRRFLKLDPRVLALCVSLVLGIVGIYAGYLPKDLKSLFLVVGAVIGSSTFSDKVVDGVRDVIIKK